jgi:hypothetical protein
MNLSEFNADAFCIIDYKIVFNCCVTREVAAENSCSVEADALFAVMYVIVNN